MDEPLSTNDILQDKDKTSRWRSLQTKFDNSIDCWSNPEYADFYPGFKNDYSHLVSATGKYRHTLHVLAEIQRRLAAPNLSNKNRQYTLNILEQCEMDLYLFAYHAGYYSGMIDGIMRELPEYPEQ